MKKFFSLVLVLCLAFSVCALSACDDNNKSVENLYADFDKFDSYVPTGSDIIGTWAMTAPATDMEWQFFANTTLHQTKIQGEIRTSTVCTYNYDGEGNLKVYVFNDEAESAYVVELEGKNLALTDKDGVKYTFEKIK